MGDKQQVIVLESLGEELSSLDEKTLPEVLATRFEVIAELNGKLEDAQRKNDAAQKNVKKAIEDAGDLINKAKDLGQISPKHRKILFGKVDIGPGSKEYYEAVSEGLKELAEYSTDAAIYQKQLAELQNSTLLSQAAVVDVQRCHMEYVEQTANALKFLYGLSAYGIASTQSIVTNLELVLSGAKKKELGAMAKEQMYLVMDQLKSQENLQIRMEKNEDKIETIRKQLKVHDEMYKDHEEQLAHKTEKDKKQDSQLRKQIEKDIEHDKAIEERIEKDREQDVIIQSHSKKDKEHDKRLNAGDIKDKEQDKQINIILKKNEELSKSYALLKKHIQRTNWVRGSAKRR